MGTHLSNKYSQKLLQSVKKFTTDAIKTTSKRAIQQTTEATGDLIVNKTADKIPNLFKNFSRKLHSAELPSQNNKTNNEIEIPKERYVSPERKQQIIDKLTFV